MTKPLLLIFLVQACFNMPHRELPASDEQHLRGVTEDRSTWVDPNAPF